MGGKKGGKMGGNNGGKRGSNNRGKMGKNRAKSNSRKESSTKSSKSSKSSGQLLDQSDTERLTRLWNTILSYRRGDRDGGDEPTTNYSILNQRWRAGHHD